MGQDVLLGAGFNAEGEVSLASARIGGWLDCSGGTFGNPGSLALDAYGLQVDQAVLLSDDFEAEGEVRLVGARIGGWLSCNGGEFYNSEGLALNADRLQVDQDVLLGAGFEAKGEVNLIGVRVGSHLSCRDGSFRNPQGRALILERAEVAHLLLLPAVVDGDLDLTNARVGRYNDNPVSWSAHVGLRLGGFTYDTIEATPPVSYRQRLEWLRRDAGGFSPQPYEQLAATYRRAGAEERAVWVAINQRRQRRPQMSFIGRVIDLANDRLVGYGYRPARLAVWLALLLALSTATFSVAYARGLLTPATKAASGFNPLAYGLDWWGVPFLNLHQRDVWIAHGPVQVLAICFAAAGWILTTLVVGVLSGVLKRG